MKEVAKEPRKLSEVIKNNSYILPISAGLLALLAPIGYLIGLGYQAGYLGAFGVPTSAFPLSITDGYINGYYVILFYAIDLFIYIADSSFWWSVLCTLLILFFVFYVFVKAVRYGHPESEKHIPLPEKIQNFLHYFHPSQNDLTATALLFFKMLSVVSTVVYLMILFMLIWMMITFLSHEKGRQHATDSKENFVKSGCILDEHSQTSKCIIIFDKSEQPVVEGLLIALNDKRYAVFTEEGPVISELPDGAKIVKHFDKQHFLDTKLTSP